MFPNPAGNEIQPSLSEEDLEDGCCPPELQERCRHRIEIQLCREAVQLGLITWLFDIEQFGGRASVFQEVP